MRNIVDSLLPVCCFSVRFPRHRQILSQALIFFLASMRARWLSPHPAFRPFGFIPGNSVFLAGLLGKLCCALPSIRLLCPRVCSPLQPGLLPAAGSSLSRGLPRNSPSLSTGPGQPPATIRAPVKAKPASDFFFPSAESVFPYSFTGVVPSSSCQTTWTQTLPGRANLGQLTLPPHSKEP